MKIISFVGETFEKIDDKYYAKPTSAAFLQDTIGKENVFVLSSFNENANTNDTSSFSTEVNNGNFYQFERYSSTKDFVIKSIFKKGFLNTYKNKSDEIIKSHAGNIFWIRTPSMGSILFGLRVLKSNEILLNHMCADFTNTWKNPKYSKIEKIFGFMLSKILKYYMKQICSHPNTINLTTGDVLEDFAKRYSKNTYQFVDVMVKPVINNNIEKKQNDNLTLLFVGRIVEDKGIFDLITVIKQINKKINLTIIGDGPDLQKAIDFVKTNNLENQIKFTGQLNHSELSSYYFDSDLVVIPSNNFYEGFPRVIMEAWSHEKPVIVSQVGGIKAFVKNNDNGLIFSPGDKKQLEDCINKILNDSNLLEKITIGAKKMKEVSLQKYWMNKVLEIIKEKTKNA
jgi:glycosyltransferase involved in cell wall biosynthesis